METVITEKRGKFLTAVLFLYTLSLISSLLPQNPDSSHIFSNLWISEVSLYYVKFLLEVYLLWSIWFWKKAGVYGKLLLDLALFILFFYWNLNTKFINESHLYVLVIVVLAYICTDGILLWAVKRKWKYFR